SVDRPKASAIAIQLLPVFLRLVSGELCVLLLPWPACDHYGRNSTARTEIAFDLSPHRFRPAHNVFENSVDDIFLKNSEIAVGLQVFFVGLQLEAALAGHVAESNDAKIRQPGFWTHGSEFGIVDDDLVSGELVRP